MKLPTRFIQWAALVAMLGTMLLLEWLLGRAYVIGMYILGHALVGTIIGKYVMARWPDKG